MQQARSERPAQNKSEAEHLNRDGALLRYRQTCREVDRLLDEGNLSEAVALNEEARLLFRQLFGEP